MAKRYKLYNNGIISHFLGLIIDKEGETEEDVTYRMGGVDEVERCFCSAVWLTHVNKIEGEILLFGYKTSCALQSRKLGNQETTHS